MAGVQPGRTGRTVTDDDVARHFPLVRHVMARMLREGQLARRHDLDDVEAVGRWAVFDALRRFDPSKGVAQSTYLSSYIWGYVMRYQRDVSRSTGWHRQHGQVARVDSLDAPVNEGGRTLLDIVAEQAGPGDDARRAARRLLDVTAGLSGRERLIAEHMLAGESVRDAARHLGISQGIGSRIGLRLRRAFADALDDAP